MGGDQGCNLQKEDRKNYAIMKPGSNGIRCRARLKARQGAETGPWRRADMIATRCFSPKDRERTIRFFHTDGAITLPTVLSALLFPCWFSLQGAKIKIVIPNREGPI